MKNPNNMFSTMYEVKLDKDLGQFLVVPMGADEQKDYGIICSNEYDAKSLCAQIAMQMVASPEEAPLKYSSKGLHPNGHTLLYCLK